MTAPQDDAAPAADAPAVPAAVPAQSPEDTDAGWGDYGEPDDDARLRGDRPPHWEP
jgi:hypothetical protein